MLKKFIYLKLVKSFIGKNKKNKIIFNSLGLRKKNLLIKVKNISSIRGMIIKILKFIKILKLC